MSAGFLLQQQRPSELKSELTLSRGWPPGVTLRRLNGAPPSCVEVYELLLPPPCPTMPLPVVVLVLWCRVDESPLWYVAVPFSTSPLLCRGGSAVVAIL